MVECSYGSVAAQREHVIIGISLLDQQAGVVDGQYSRQIRQLREYKIVYSQANFYRVMLYNERLLFTLKSIF